MKLQPGVRGTCTASDDNVHRYFLSRVWDEDKPPMLVIGLNPSMADAENDDPTIRKCIAYARQYGYGSLAMLNLFSIRMTDPKGLKKDRYLDELTDGEKNMDHVRMALQRNASMNGVVVLAWGAHGKAFDQDRTMLRLLNDLEFTEDLLCWGHNKDASPSHPLYLPMSQTLRYYYPDF